jgi:hypothetical protein
MNEYDDGRPLLRGNRLPISNYPVTDPGTGYMKLAGPFVKVDLKITAGFKEFQPDSGIPCP